jgi:multiple sugar transport system substrate-binding protein
LTAKKSLDADVVIYPSVELGGLAERDLLRPIPGAWLDRPEYAKKDLFELPGLRETAWGETTYAVPLGSPVLVLFYRTDLFALFGKQAPTTWSEYHLLVEFFANRENLKAPATSDGDPLKAQLPALDLPADWHGALEPLAAGWAGKMLLARAAPYAKHRDYYATLFYRDTLVPRIAEPPLVRALTELVAAAKSGGTKAWLDSTPAAARDALLQGRSAMAIGWPTAAEAAAPNRRTEFIPFNQPGSNGASIGFVELPGSPQVFSPRDHNWVPRQPDEDPHIPLFGVAGRMGSVVKRTTAADSALELLVWLSTAPWDRQICPSSPATTLFRHSQLAEPSRWVETGLPPAAARQYADVAARALTRDQWLFAPRLPGHAEYLAALDDAVRAAVAGERSPQEALTAASDRWQKITARLGLESQRAAYLRSIGLEP